MEKNLCIHGNDFTLSSTTCRSTTSCLFDAIPDRFNDYGYEKSKSVWGKEVVEEFLEKYGDEFPHLQKKR